MCASFSSDNMIMVDGRMLTDKSKEELIRIILEKDKLVDELERENKELREKIKAEQQKRNEKFAKPNAPKKRRMRPGQKLGHVGMTRSVPDHIDEILEQTLCECPACHHSLNESVEVIEQVQEDIIPAHVRVRKYRRHRYYCQGCQKIADLFKDMAGLTVSPGGLSQALARVSDWLGVEKKVLLTAIRGSPQVHADETGWRLDGKKSWVWAFVNERLAYYEVNRSRGRKVVRNILTDSFKGVLISDFYGVYFNLPYKKQKCLVHLLREFRECSKRDPSEEYKLNYKKIKRLINDALRLRDQREKLSKMVYLRRVVDIKQRLFNFMMSPYENKNLQRLSKRFNKFWLDMFTFLQDPAVAWNNNLAERMIRPHVIYRNRSFGNRSDRGAKAHGTIMSLMQTLRLQGRNVSDNLREAFLRHRQGDTKPQLSFMA